MWLDMRQRWPLKRLALSAQTSSLLPDPSRGMMGKTSKVPGTPRLTPTQLRKQILEILWTQAPGSSQLEGRLDNTQSDPSPLLAWPISLPQQVSRLVDVQAAAGNIKQVLLAAITGLMVNMQEISWHLEVSRGCGLHEALCHLRSPISGSTAHTADWNELESGGPWQPGETEELSH